MKTTFIYGLTDPRTGVVRYVGKANDPQLRLTQHLKEEGRTHKFYWIRHLAKLNLEPGLVILEEVGGEKEAWGEAERKWISQLPNLTNGTKGGDGVDTESAKVIAARPEVREMRLASSAKTYKTKEYKEKKSKSSKATWVSSRRKRIRTACAEGLALLPKEKQDEVVEKAQLHLAELSKTGGLFDCSQAGKDAYLAKLNDELKDNNS